MSSCAFGYPSPAPLERREQQQLTRVTVIRDDGRTSEYLARLDQLEQLPNNWDGYGSPPLNGRALPNAKQLVSVIPLGSFEVPQVSPISGGGIGVSWHLGDKELELTLLPDGLVEYLTVERQGRGDEASEAGVLPEDFAARARELLKWLASA